MAVDATSSAAAAAANTDSARTRLADNFETFLSLLTAQLKNQDPLSPMDSNQFTQQIVQMTGVEQQLLTNDLLKKLVATSSRGIGEAVSLIGKDIKATGAQTNLKNGAANWTYDLDAAAADVQVKVVDANGKVVHSASPSGLSQGEHAFTWDGKDDSGRQLPDGGPYTLQVTARDATGASIASQVMIVGRVTGVETLDGETLLSVGASKVPWTAVTSIAEHADETTDGQTPSQQAA